MTILRMILIPIVMVLGYAFTCVAGMALAYAFALGVGSLIGGALAYSKWLAIFVLLSILLGIVWFFRMKSVRIGMKEMWARMKDSF